MSEMSAYYATNHTNRDLVAPSGAPPMWTQRDGTQIAVVDMSDGHLANVITLLQRQHEARLARLEERLTRDGDHRGVLSALSDAGPVATFPIYTALVNEEAARVLRCAAQRQAAQAYADYVHSWGGRL